jgi:hypothetical protein
MRRSSPCLPRAGRFRGSPGALASPGRWCAAASSPMPRRSASTRGGEVGSTRMSRTGVDGGPRAIGTPCCSGARSERRATRARADKCLAAPRTDASGIRRRRGWAGLGWSHTRSQTSPWGDRLGGHRSPSGVAPGTRSRRPRRSRPGPARTAPSGVFPGGHRLPAAPGDHAHRQGAGPRPARRLAWRGHGLRPARPGHVRRRAPARASRTAHSSHATLEHRPSRGHIARLKLIKRQGYGRAGLATLKRGFLRAA